MPNKTKQTQKIIIVFRKNKNVKFNLLFRESSKRQIEPAQRRKQIVAGTIGQVSQTQANWFVLMLFSTTTRFVHNIKA